MTKGLAKNKAQPKKPKSGSAKKRINKSTATPAFTRPSASANKYARVHRSKLNAHPIFGSPNFASNCEDVPAAFTNFESNSTWVSAPGPVSHKYLGIDGVRLTGCQPFTDIVTAAATSALFTTGTLATSGANSIAVSPDAFNGPLAAQANMHEKYVFRDILIEYVTNVATTQAGSMALAYSVDGGQVAAPTTFSQTRSIVPSMVCAFREGRAYLHYHYDGMETWFTLIDATDSATSRLTIQGAIFGFPSATSLGAITQGFTNVWYIVELYQPVNSQGFTMSVKNDDEYRYLRKILAQRRADEKATKLLLLRDSDGETKMREIERLRSELAALVSSK